MVFGMLGILDNGRKERIRDEITVKMMTGEINECLEAYGEFYSEDADIISLIELVKLGECEDEKIEEIKQELMNELLGKYPEEKELKELSNVLFLRKVDCKEFLKGLAVKYSGTSEFLILNTLVNKEEGAAKVVAINGMIKKLQNKNIDDIELSKVTGYKNGAIHIKK